MERNNRKAIFRLTSLGAVMLFMTACAANSELSELQEAHQETESRIQTLERQVSEAMAAAERAQQAADEARAAADEAQACCEANTERMDRLFERAVQKN